MEMNDQMKDKKKGRWWEGVTILSRMIPRHAFRKGAAVFSLKQTPPEHAGLNDVHLQYLSHLLLSFGAFFWPSFSFDLLFSLAHDSSLLLLSGGVPWVRGV